MSQTIVSSTRKVVALDRFVLIFEGPATKTLLAMVTMPSLPICGFGCCLLIIPLLVPPFVTTFA